MIRIFLKFCHFVKILTKKKKNSINFWKLYYVGTVNDIKFYWKLQVFTVICFWIQPKKQYWFIKIWLCIKIPVFLNLYFVFSDYIKKYFISDPLKCQLHQIFPPKPLSMLKIKAFFMLQKVLTDTKINTHYRKTNIFISPLWV